MIHFCFKTAKVSLHNDNSLRSITAEILNGVHVKFVTDDQPYDSCCSIKDSDMNINMRRMPSFVFCLHFLQDSHYLRQFYEMQPIYRFAMGKTEVIYRPPLSSGKEVINFMFVDIRSGSYLF